MKKKRFLSKEENNDERKKEMEGMIKEEFGIQSEMMKEKSLYREMIVLIENVENFETKEKIILKVN